MLYCITDNYEILVAAAALITSVVSIFLGILTAKEQRKHNRLSLLPIGRILLGNYENELYVNIKNTGVGPLIIENITVLKNQVKLQGSLLKAMPHLPGNYMWDDFVEELQDYCVLPGDFVCLLKLSGDPTDPTYRSAREDVRQALSDLTLSVHYSDVYDSKTKCITRNLSWFAQ